MNEDLSNALRQLMSFFSSEPAEYAVIETLFNMGSRKGNPATPMHTMLFTLADLSKKYPEICLDDRFNPMIIHTLQYIYQRDLSQKKEIIKLIVSHLDDLRPSLIKEWAWVLPWVAELPSDLFDASDRKAFLQFLSMKIGSIKSPIRAIFSTLSLAPFPPDVQTVLKERLPRSFPPPSPKASARKAHHAS